MNLRAVANRMTSAINPNIPAQLMLSSGYSTNAAGSRAPGYAPPINLMVQVQPMSGGDIRKTDNLNIQGVKMKAYLSGNTEAMVRVATRGGDLISFAGQTYIVAIVLERWPDWCCVGLTLQNGK